MEIVSFQMVIPKHESSCSWKNHRTSDPRLDSQPPKKHIGCFLSIFPQCKYLRRPFGNTSPRWLKCQASRVMGVVVAVVVTSTASVADVRSVKCVATGKSLVTASRDLSCASFSQKGVMHQKVLITWIQMVEKSCVIFGDFWSSGIAKNSSLERRCFDSELMHSNHHSQLEPRNFFQDVQQRTSKKSNHQHLLSTAFWSPSTARCNDKGNHSNRELQCLLVPYRSSASWASSTFENSPWRLKQTKHLDLPTPRRSHPQDFVNVKWSYQQNRAPALKRKQILCNKFCFRTIASPRDIEMIFGKMCDV